MDPEEESSRTPTALHFLPKILQRAASSGPGALRKDNEDGASCHLILTGPQETRAQLLTSAPTPSQEDPYLES